MKTSVITLVALFMVTSAFSQISGANVVCSGVYNHYTSVTNGDSIRWTISSGTIDPSTVSGNSVDAKFTADGTLTKTIRAYYDAVPHWRVQATETYNVAIKVIPSITAASPSCPSVTISRSGGNISSSLEWQKSLNGTSGWTQFSTSTASSVSTTISQKTYFRLVHTGCSPNLVSSIISVDLKPSVSQAVIAGAQTLFPGATASNLTITTPPLTDGNYYSQWMKRPSGGNWTTASANVYGNVGPLSPGVINQTTDFKLVAKWNCDTNVTSESNIITITIQSLPAIRTVTNPSLAIGASLTLESINTHYSYQWMKDDVDIPGATGNTLVVTKPASYKLKAKASAVSDEKISPAKVIYKLGYEPDNTSNKIVTTIIRKAGVSSSTDLYSLQSSDYSQTITYLDGLARPTQTIAIGQSPQQKDLIVPYRYDSIQSISYLPYVSSVRNGWYDTQALNHQSAFYQSTTTKVEATNHPYAITLMESSPLRRPKEIGAPGDQWQPGNNTIRPLFQANDASAIKIWTPSGPTGSTYAAGKLNVSQLKDENGNLVFTYSTKTGQQILKRVQVDATNYLETYNVYDTRDNLVLQIPPKATALLNSGSSWNTTFRDQYCFIYNYDPRNRLIEKKVPDADWVSYGYDPLDRLVLIQDGNIKSQNKWVFIKYDFARRSVITGFYTNTTYTSRADIQSNVLDGLYSNVNDPYFEERGSALHGYTNRSFPTANAPSGAIDPLMATYYDNYDFDNNGSADVTYASQGLADEASPGSGAGKLTGTKKLILNSSNWLYEYQFYDPFGQPIQSRSNNYRSAAVDNIATIVYDFVGNVLVTRQVHKGGGSNQFTITNKTSYDAGGRKTKAYQSINDRFDRLIAKYNYNELSQVVEKNLHLIYDGNETQPDGLLPDTLLRSSFRTGENTLKALAMVTLKPGYTFSGNSLTVTVASPTTAEANGQFLQSVDYRYNIRGWLKSINNASLSQNSTNDDLNDYFGMEILYGETDLQLGNTGSYNGNISAIKWKGVGAGAGAEDMRSYKFTYDKSDRLTASTFQKYDGSANWNREVGMLNEMQNYDANGNILSLQRKRIKRNAQLVGTHVNSVPAAELLDDLTYTYATGKSNQLSAVDDDGVDDDGFTDSGAASNDYRYTSAGSMSSDRNKGIDSITYNFLNKPEVITFAGSPAKTVTYTYDAGGNKLRMIAYDGTKTITTDYVDGFVYVNDTLSFMGTPEGRAIYSGNGEFEYQYNIADHQGNTRVVFSSKAPAPDEYTATFEDNTQDEEESTFENYPTGGSRSGMELFDHTDFNGTVYSHSQLLNGGYNSQVGLSKVVKVYPGDQVHAEVYAKYWNATDDDSNITAFATALTDAFGLNSGMTGEALKAFNALNDYGGLVASMDGTGDEGDAPKAYITVLLFDQNFNFVDVAYDRVSTAAEQDHSGTKASFELLSRDVTIKDAGYAYIYVSNENPTEVDVYFDDLKITHSKSNVIQYNEYYPFGLQSQNSWTRENVVGNRFLYNQGSELNDLTGLYDTFFRGFDAALGRFIQVDPLATRSVNLSTYHYSSNSPVVRNDPSGAADTEFYYARGLHTFGTSNYYAPMMDNPGGGGGGTSYTGAGLSQEVWDLLTVLWNVTPEGTDQTYTGFGSNGTPQGGLFTYTRNGQMYGGNYLAAAGSFFVSTSKLKPGVTDPDAWISDGPPETVSFDFGGETRGNGPGDPPSFLSRLASFLPAVDFDLNVGVGPALGVEILGQKVEANLATFSIFNKKLSYSNGTFNSSKSTVFQEGRVTQGIAVPFAGIQREQVVGDPNAQVDSYTLGIRTEHFDSNGKSIGQKLSSGWGISLIFTLQFEISIH